jgi:hypothetical protein
MTRKLTETEWAEALKKWLDRSLGYDNDTDCVCCNLYIHNDDCCGCPLNMGGYKDEEVENGRCYNPKHPWKKWFDKSNRKNAFSMFEFIYSRYLKSKRKVSK